LDAFDPLNFLGKIEEGEDSLKEDDVLSYRNIAICRLIL
jgi:hypothetical protein